MGEERDKQFKLSGDRPKKSIDEDQFGLSKIVEVIAANVTDNLSVDGYAIGLEGEWGSGKTSVANFVVEQIESLSAHAKIVRLDPWLIGNKAAFISTFLAEFATKIDEYERSKRRWWNLYFWTRRYLKRGFAAKIRKYGEYSNVLSSAAAGAAIYDPSGVTALTAVGLKGFGGVTKFINPSSKTIAALKSDIIEFLRKIANDDTSPRFVVVIDDSDRLEPSEAVEILRLIREVADFPLTTYLVCFDRAILGQQIRSALRIRNGADYIEKIFHQIVSVPPQEPFALRRYLNKLLLESYPTELATLDQKERDYDYRKYLLLDVWTGSLLKTPRDVVRLFEAIKFGWAHLPKESDFVDFAWLQLVKLKASELYEFTQSYLVNVGAYRDGGRPGDDEPEKQAEKLYKIMKEFNWEDKPYRSGIGEFLPGIKQFALNEKNRKVFQFEHNELAHFEKSRRLGSPTHWRQYFAFSLPTYALSDDEIAAFRHAAVAGATEASAKLLELLRRPSTRSGQYVDVLLDRLNDLPADALTAKEMLGIAEALSNTMDEVGITTNEIWNLGRSEIWPKATRLLKRSKAGNFAKLVRNGQAVGWLSDAVRDQGFAHGRPEGNRVNTERQWLSVSQLDSAIASIIERFRKINSVKLLSGPSPLDVLYLWQQLGKANELPRFLSNWTKLDDDFLLAINAMRGWVSSSDTGIGHPVRRSTVSSFMDAEKAKGRLQKIAANGQTAELKSRARTLLSEWEDDSSRDR